MSAETNPIPMLDLARLHAPFKEELSAALTRIMDSSNYINGPAVTGFEKNLASHVGSCFCIGVSSGTDALLVALMALSVKPGDEIITTPYTFFATAGCVSRLGAVPVFVDIDPVSFNIDPAKIEEKITERTVGVIPVHLFGNCARIDKVMEIASRHGLWVLEDAAQSIGSTFGDQQSGTIGTAGTYSFFPAKNLGALGDGGAVVTDDEELAGDIQALRGHGAKVKYYHDTVGGNFRLDALQAAFLDVKLAHLREWEEGRRRVAKNYLFALGGKDGISLPVEEEGNRHVFNQYVIRVRGRDALKSKLLDMKIGCAVYYPVALHLQPCFSYLDYREGACPESERACLESLAIPVDPNLTENQQGRIVDAICEHLAIGV